MTSKPQGVIPYQGISKLIDESKVRAKSPISNLQIQPSSLDLRLSSTAWRLQASFLPGIGCKVADQLTELSMHEINLSSGSIFEKNCVYLVLLKESVSLPEDLTAISNAKSSIGRLDLLTRLITDYGTEFDRIPSSYSGPLYAEVSPRSFSVLVKEGISLNQIRFRRGKVIIDDHTLIKLNNEVGLIGTNATVDGGISFSIDLEKVSNQTLGYKAKPHTPLIDLSKTNFYKIDDFWDPIEVKDGRLILDPGAFYILMSKETVTIPPNFAAEMAPYLAIVGEFRVHYAGFFDPGFGFPSTGDTGSRGVLEIRCYEAPFALRSGQIIGRLIYERMAEVPEILYGSKLKSNYQGQKLKLSKHFKDK